MALQRPKYAFIPYYVDSNHIMDDLVWIDSNGWWQIIFSTLKKTGNSNTQLADHSRWTRDKIDGPDGREYTLYLHYLAVDSKYSGQGIGKSLIIVSHKRLRILSWSILMAVWSQKIAILSNDFNKRNYWLLRFVRIQIEKDRICHTGGRVSKVYCFKCSLNHFPNTLQGDSFSWTPQFRHFKHEWVLRRYLQGGVVLHF